MTTFKKPLFAFAVIGVLGSNLLSPIAAHAATATTPLPLQTATHGGNVYGPLVPSTNTPSFTPQLESNYIDWESASTITVPADTTTAIDPGDASIATGYGSSMLPFPPCTGATFNTFSVTTTATGFPSTADGSYVSLAFAVGDSLMPPTTVTGGEQGNRTGLAAPGTNGLPLEYTVHGAEAGGSGANGTITATYFTGTRGDIPQFDVWVGAVNRGAIGAKVSVPVVTALWDTSACPAGATTTSNATAGTPNTGLEPSASLAIVIASVLSGIALAAVAARRYVRQ